MAKFITWHPDFKRKFDNGQIPKKLCVYQARALTWHAQKGRMEFCDAMTGEVMSCGNGGVVERQEGIGIFSYMEYDFCNRLLACDVQLKAAVRFSDDKRAVFGNQYKDGKINPVAMATHSCGIIYIGCPEGIYYILPENRNVIKASGAININPLNLCITENESSIIFANALTKTVTKLDFNSDATLGFYRTFVFASDFDYGLPTDIKIDSTGWVYMAEPDGVHIYNACGMRLGTVDFGYPVHSLCIGGEDGCTLYSGTSDGIYMLKLKL